LEDIVFFRDVPYGLEEHPEVGKKGYQSSETQFAGDDVPTSVPDDKCYSHGADDFNDGNEEGKDDYLFHAGEIILMIDPLKPLKILLLPPEELHNLHARNIFLDGCVNLCHLEPYLPEGIPCTKTEEYGKNDNQREEGQADEGERPADPEKYDNDPQKEGDVTEEIDHDGCEHLVNIFNVIGGTGNKSSNRVVVKEGKRKFLEVEIGRAHV